MPFRNYKQFDQTTLAILQDAYDRALARIGATANDSRSGILAAAIAKLADDGERDPAILCDLALRRLGAAEAIEQNAARHQPTKSLEGGLHERQ
jgi:hypothetical protein